MTIYLQLNGLKKLYEVESRKISSTSMGNKFENISAEISHAKI